MAWEQLSVGEICRPVTDRRHYGGRGPAQLADHLAHDSLFSGHGRPAATAPRDPIAAPALS
jgi:hypothetical protein